MMAANKDSDWNGDNLSEISWTGPVMKAGTELTITDADDIPFSISLFLLFIQPLPSSSSPSYLRLYLGLLLHLLLFFLLLLLLLFFLFLFLWHSETTYSENRRVSWHIRWLLVEPQNGKRKPNCSFIWLGFDNKTETTRSRAAIAIEKVKQQNPITFNQLN